MRLMVIVLFGLCVAACSTSTGSTATTKRASITTNTASRATVTTKGPPPSITVPTTLACLSGTVTLPFQGPGQLSRACIKVGSILVMNGGGNMSAGKWPGPPDISDTHVLTLVSSHGGTDFNARFKAIGPGAASVEVPFVAGPDVCNPTPCTPVPGGPLMLQVTVVG